MLSARLFESMRYMLIIVSSRVYDLQDAVGYMEILNIIPAFVGLHFFSWASTGIGTSIHLYTTPNSGRV